ILAQNRLVGLCRAADGSNFSLHAMDIRRRNGNTNEEFAAHHTVIAVGMVGRNSPFIAPEKMDARPINLGSKFLGGEQAIHLTRRRAAGKPNAKLAVTRDGLPSPVYKAAGGGARYFGCIAADENAGENFLRQEIRVFASVGHCAPGVDRLGAAPSCRQHNLEPAASFRRAKL